MEKEVRSRDAAVREAIQEMPSAMDIVKMGAVENLIGGAGK